MANWILSAFADEYSSNLADQIKALQDLEIGHIELRFLNGKNVADLTENEAAEVKK